MKKVLIALAIIVLVVINVRMCGPFIFGDKKSKSSSDFDQDKNMLAVQVDNISTHSLMCAKKDDQKNNDDKQTLVAVSELIPQKSFEQDQKIEPVQKLAQIKKESIQPIITYEQQEPENKQPEEEHENITKLYVTSNAEIDCAQLKTEEETMPVAQDEPAQKYAKLEKRLSRILEEKTETVQLEQELQSVVECANIIENHNETDIHTLNDALSVNIDVARKKMAPKQKSAPRGILNLQSTLDKKLMSLARKADFGEIGMQAILNLLDLEIEVVDLLLNGDNGYVVEQAVKAKQHTLQQTMLSAVQIHDMILNVATLNADLEMKLQKYMRGHKKRLHHALSLDNKQAFLDHMRYTLGHYYSTIENTQYEMVAW